MLKNKKGFTLIELIIVMVIIGILVLLATPKFLDHVNQAKLTQIKNDTKVAEDMITVKMTYDELDFNTLSFTDKKGGLNKDSKHMKDIETLTGNTYDITNLVNSKLSGRFISNEEGKVVYYDENKPETPVDTELLAKDEDFEFIEDENYGYEVKGKGKGYFRYNKNNKIVEIPHTIQGHEMTSYYKMFDRTSVEKVISTNTNISDMEGMFELSRATKLDLSSLNTSKVRDMSRMFAHSKATKLDLSSFDTSNVTDMNNMFGDSSATELDLSNFNTSNVTNMSSMFYSSNAKSLNLSSFDTSNVEYMGSMFRGSSAEEINLSSFNTSKVIYMGDMFKGANATIGYARTEEDAKRFNDKDFTCIPDTLKFKVDDKEVLTKDYN